MFWREARLTLSLPVPKPLVTGYLFYIHIVIYMFPWYSQSIPFSPSLTVDSTAASPIKTNKQKIYIYTHTHTTFICQWNLNKAGKRQKKKHTQNFLVLLCFSASIASFDPVFHNRSVQSTRYQQVSGLTKSIQDYVVLFYWEDDLHCLS